MDSRYPYPARSPLQGSRETSPNPSMTDLAQHRPSPLRKNVAFSKGPNPGSKSSAASEAEKNKPFLLRNPFSSSADTSPTGSIADVELDQLNQFTIGPSSAAMSSRGANSSVTISTLSNGFNPISVERDRDVISLSGQESISGLRRHQKHEFKSYLLNAPYEQPWKKDKRMKRTTLSNIIVYFFIIAALALSVLINWQATKQVEQHDYCLVLDDQFKSLDSDVWNHEVQLNGFGTGSFDWTTTDDKNSYVDNEGLHIIPTLTTETTSITPDQMMDGFTLNLTQSGGDGSCTDPADSPDYLSACAVTSNKTSAVIIPPVRSARLNTKGKKSIQYGRVEVTAKMPSGDWLWPAIWMMPEDSVYGPWPQSGEIDIMETRGNNVSYKDGGKDIYSSTLHWGPSSRSDSFYLTTASRPVRRSDYSKNFHVFGIEWSKDYMFTYLDNRLHQVLYVDFHKTNMWNRGHFANRLENFTLLTDPWTSSTNNNAPFDQKFYLILNVAVGARNGWFPDSIGGKPWVDAYDGARSDFYTSSQKWLPTWGKGQEAGMTVSRVRMWQEGKC